MIIACRNIFLAAVAISALAGCQATVTDCDKSNPKKIHVGKCCGAGDTPCKEGKNGDKSPPTPDPTPG